MILDLTKNATNQQVCVLEARFGGPLTILALFNHPFRKARVIPGYEI